MAGHAFDAGAQTLAAGSNVTVCNLIELLLQEAGQAIEPVRLCTGFYPVAWNGYTWTASGYILNIGEVTESLSPVSQQVSITVSGATAEMRAAALDSQYRYSGRPITLYTAILDGSYQVSGTPDIAFKGFVSRMQIIDRAGVGGNNGRCDVVISCTTRFARLKASSERRMSDEQQRALYPGDTGLRFMAPLLEDVSIPFGQRA